jgi:hypothetical protein
MKNNKEVASSQNDQVHPHHEGQQQNTVKQNNNSSETEEISGERQGVSNTTESESERAKRNEDEGIRGGNSSV